MANNLHLDEIIFEERNKSYGAYEIRKTYDRNLITAISTAVTLVLVFVAIPTIAKYLHGTETLATAIPKPKVTVCPALPPPIDVTLPPPPKVYATPPTAKMVPFMKPEITEEEVLPEEEMPTVADAKANVTGVETIDGSSEIANFDGPIDQPAVMAEVENEKPYLVVEQMPTFKGGVEALMNFLGKHIKYPPMAVRMGIKGTVFVGFVISKEGSIDDVVIVKGISKECDEEAIRVVKSMPHWNAGKQNGKTVAVRFVLPIKFELAE
ncbi:MAG: TonB family protein [Bacteroidota bacterium]